MGTEPAGGQTPRVNFPYNSERMSWCELWPSPVETTHGLYPHRPVWILQHSTSYICCSYCFHIYWSYNGPKSRWFFFSVDLLAQRLDFHKKIFFRSGTNGCITCTKCSPSHYERRVVFIISKLQLIITIENGKAYFTKWDLSLHYRPIFLNLFCAMSLSLSKIRVPLK